MKRFLLVMLATLSMLAMTRPALALTMHVVPRAEEPTTVERPTEPMALDLNETPSRDDKASDERTAEDRKELRSPTSVAGSVSTSSVMSQMGTTSTTAAVATTSTPGMLTTTNVIDTANVTDTAVGPSAISTGESFATEEGFVFEEPFGGVEAMDPGLDWGAMEQGAPEDTVSPPARAKASRPNRALPSVAQWLFVPTELAPQPGGPVKPFHITLQTDVYDARNNNPVRELRDSTAGSFYQSNVSMAYDHIAKDGTQWTAGLTGRLTDDTQLVAAAKTKRFTIQGEPFLQVGRGGDYIARFGIVSPQFTPYTFLSSALGTHLSKQYKHKNQITEVQFFGGELDRRNSPAQYERLGGGVRLSNMWDFQKDGILELGGQIVSLRDDRDSIGEVFTGIEFERSTVGSINMAYDHPKGYHMLAESAHSGAEINNTMLLTETHLTGGAARQGVAYKDPKTGRGLRFEHERLDDTFIAVKGADGDDLDHQLVGLDYPVSPKATVTATYDRVYNDIHRTLLTRSQAKTYQVDVGLDPFNTDKSRWLKGLHFDLGGIFAKLTSEDLTLDAFNRDWKLVIAEHIGRFGASYNYAPRQELTYDSLVDTWHRNKHTYQIEYTILGDKNGYWSIHPIINYVRDNNRNDGSLITDLEDNITYALDGKYGRNTFGSSYGTDRSQLFNTATFQSSKAFQANFQRAFDVEGNLKGSVTYTSNNRADTNNPALKDHRILASVSKRW